MEGGKEGTDGGRSGGEGRRHCPIRDLIGRNPVREGRS